MNSSYNKVPKVHTIYCIQDNIPLELYNEMCSDGRSHRRVHKNHIATYLPSKSCSMVVGMHRQDNLDSVHLCVSDLAHLRTNRSCDDITYMDV